MRLAYTEEVGGSSPSAPISSSHGANTTKGLTMQHIRVGGTFSGGVVVSINREGIFVLKNGMTRFYTAQEVEQTLDRALAAGTR